MTYDVDHLFIGLFAICFSSLVNCLLRSKAQFLIRLLVFLLLSLKSSLCILDNCPLSDVSFANIFSYFVVCLLILLTLCFTEQKFLILMKSSLTIISFMSYAFGVISKKALTYLRLSRLSPMLSFRSFIVLRFTFRSMIHFEVIFWNGVRSVSRFFFFFKALFTQWFEMTSL